MIRLYTIFLSTGLVFAGCGGGGDDDIVDPGPDAFLAPPGAADPDAAATNGSPTASFSFAPTCTTSSSTEVTFTSTSTDPDDDTLACSWVIMNGNPSTASSCEVTGVTFPNLTPYPVTITVDDGRGGTDSHSVNVGPCP